MKRTYVYTIVFSLIAVLGGLYLTRQVVPSEQEVKQSAKDHKNIAYTIDGKQVMLVNGVSETEIVPGSASKVVTKYFGNEAVGDLNGDGVPDVAFLLTQESGGSGTFYYAVVALKIANGYEGTNGALLGDRIAPQTTEIRNGEVIVNYADRAPAEPMTARPSIGKSKYLIVDGTTLKESQRIVGAGERCGGNMLNAPMCADGSHCAPEPDSHLPFGDVGGVCVPN